MGKMMYRSRTQFFQSRPLSIGMHSEFWHERWQRGETGWHLDSVNPLLEQNWSRLEVEPPARVLVPLCGKSHDLGWLARRGHRVVGVELSRIAVDGFFADYGVTPEIGEASPFRRYTAGGLDILCGDFFDLEPWHVAEVEAIYDRGSLVALPPDLRERYVSHLQGLFPKPARMLLITFDYAQSEMDGPPFSVGEEEVARLFGASHRIDRLTITDALPVNPRFLERGVTAMNEIVLELTPRVPRCS